MIGAVPGQPTRDMGAEDARAPGYEHGSVGLPRLPRLPVGVGGAWSAYHPAGERAGRAECQLVLDRVTVVPVERVVAVERFREAVGHGVVQCAGHVDQAAPGVGVVQPQYGPHPPHHRLRGADLLVAHRDGTGGQAPQTCGGAERLQGLDQGDRCRRAARERRLPVMRLLVQGEQREHSGGGGGGSGEVFAQLGYEPFLVRALRALRDDRDHVGAAVPGEPVDDRRGQRMGTA